MSATDTRCKPPSADPNGSGPAKVSADQETDILRHESEAKADLAEIIPIIRELPPDAIDQELIEAIDKACESALKRAETARRTMGGTTRAKRA